MANIDSLITIGANNGVGLKDGPAIVYGQTDSETTETMWILADNDGVTNGLIKVNGTVDRIDLPGNSSDFQFMARAGQLMVIDSAGNHIASFILPADGSPRTVAFGNGGVTVSLGEGNVVSMGTQVIGTDPEAYSVDKGGLLDGDIISDTAPDSGEQEPSVDSYSLQQLYELDAEGKLPSEYSISGELTVAVEDALTVAQATSMKATVAEIIADASNAADFAEAAPTYSFTVEDSPTVLEGSASVESAVAGASAVVAIGGLASLEDYPRPSFVTEVILEGTQQDIVNMPASLKVDAVILKDAPEGVVAAMESAAVTKLVTAIEVTGAAEDVFNYVEDLSAITEPAPDYSAVTEGSVDMGPDPLTVDEVKTKQTAVDALIPGKVTSWNYTIKDSVANILANEAITAKSEKNIAVGTVEELAAAYKAGNLGKALIGTWEVQDTYKNILAAKSSSDPDLQKIVNDAAGVVFPEPPADESPSDTVADIQDIISGQENVDLDVSAAVRVTDVDTPISGTGSGGNITTGDIAGVIFTLEVGSSGDTTGTGTGTVTLDASDAEGMTRLTATEATGEVKITGGTAQDYIRGSQVNQASGTVNTLVGGEGNDYIWGSKGVDTIYAGNEDGTDSVSETNVNPYLGLYIFGQTKDVYTLESGSNWLTDDVVDLYKGANVLNGGGGDDTFVLSNKKDVIECRMSLFNGNDIVIEGFDPNSDSIVLLNDLGSYYDTPPNTARVQTSLDLDYDEISGSSAITVKDNVVTLNWANVYKVTSGDDASGITTNEVWNTWHEDKFGSVPTTSTITFVDVVGSPTLTSEMVAGWLGITVTPAP